MVTTITIRCDTVAGEREDLPEDGVILPATELELPEGTSAYGQLLAAVRSYAIPMTDRGGYVAGLAQLYEFDFGELSGWVYRVNGVMAPVGCDDCLLQPGDAVEWLYTRELGRDLD